MKLIKQTVLSLLLLTVASAFPAAPADAAGSEVVPTLSRIVRCWRHGRRCENLVVNGGVDPAPAGSSWKEAVLEGFDPLVGPWEHGMDLAKDRLGDPESRSLLFAPGERDTAVNDEYLTAFHPKYKPGTYRFSFWVREDAHSLANNNWTVRLKVRDWWTSWSGLEPGMFIPSLQDGISEGAFNCYVANKTLRRPSPDGATTWRQVSMEFTVPLVGSQWDEISSIETCTDSAGHTIHPYDPATIIPGGYAIVIFPNGPGGGPSAGGEIRFDDFAIERME